MLRRPLRTLALTLALVGMNLLGGSKPAFADILLTVSAGSPTQSFDFASNALGYQVISIDGYSLSLQTTVTNFPGTSDLGAISTTINILAPVTTTDSLITTV
jgi:hypothetical protein